MINKQVPDAKENLKRMKDQIDLLPQYLQFESYMDDEGKTVKAVNNATRLQHPITKTQVLIKAGTSTPEAASLLARGLTAPILHFDEVEFTSNVDVLVDNSLSTFDTAARNARKNHAMYARIFTSTPGDLDSNPGIASQKLIRKTVRWTEKMYDMNQREMEEFARKGSSHIVYIEFQYYQIGLTEEWLNDMFEQATDPLTPRRELLLQRLHGSGLSPYKQEDIEYIADVKRNPIKTIMICQYYQLDLYEELDPSLPYLMGVDCSTGTLRDNNAITVLNPYTLRPAAEFECDFCGETAYEGIITEIVTRYIPQAIVCIERNSIGDGIIDHLLNSRIAPRLYYDRSRDLVQQKFRDKETVESMLKRQALMKSYYGVYTEGTSREQMFGILADRIKLNKDDFVSRNLIRDIGGLIKKGQRIEAGEGFHDDSVMSYLIAMYVYTHGNNLPTFGLIPGEKGKEEPNQGMHYTREHLESVLPSDVADAVIKKSSAEQATDFQDILRASILSAQAEQARLLNSSIDVDMGNVTKEELIGPSDYEMNLDIFDTLNDIDTTNRNNNGSIFGIF